MTSPVDAPVQSFREKISMERESGPAGESVDRKSGLSNSSESDMTKTHLAMVWLMVFVEFGIDNYSDGWLAG